MKKEEDIIKKVQAWLDSIDDDEMHHLGEYYSLVTKKKFYKQTRTATAAFHRWLVKYYYSGILKDLDISRFIEYSSWRGEGFLFRKKNQRVSSKCYRRKENEL